MNRVALLRSTCGLSLVAVSAVFVLAGCEPSPGRVLDVRNVRAGDFELQLQLRAEGDWGNPSNGQHLHLFCRSRDPADSRARWEDIGHGYWISGKLRSAPIARLAVDSSGFFLTDLLGGAVFSFAGCENHRLWYGSLPPEYERLRSGHDSLEYVHEVHFCVGGPQLSFEIEPDTFTDRRIVWVTSLDAGKSWQVSEGSPQALACERESERRLVLGSH